LPQFGLPFLPILYFFALRATAHPAQFRRSTMTGGSYE
jgi:hypothetical protein